MVVDLVDKISGDPSAFVDGGKSATGMSSTSNEVEVVESLETVLRSEVEHLRQGVSQIEGGSQEDVGIFPAGWSDNFTSHNVVTEILHAGGRDHLIDDFFGVIFLGSPPVVSVAGIDGRNEDVELGMSLGGNGRIGDAGITNVEGHVFRDDFLPLNVCQILVVVVGKDDVMMRLVFVEGIKTKVEHEGGAGVFLLSEVLVCLLLFSKDGGAGVGVVGIDDQLIAVEFLAVGEADLGRIFTLVEDLFDFGLVANFAAFLSDDFGHAFGNFGETTLHVVDSMFVFDIGKDTKKGGAIPGRHTEVFGLKGESEFQTVVLKVVREDVHDRFGGGDVGEGFEEIFVEVRGKTSVGFEEEGEDRFEFGCVIIHEAEKVFRLSGKRLFDIGRHFFAVAAGFEREVSPAQAGHGVELDEVHVVFGFALGLGKDFVEGEFLVEKCGAGIVAIRTVLDGGISTSGHFVLFENSDFVTSVGEKYAGGEPAGASANDDDAFVQNTELFPAEHTI